MVFDEANYTLPKADRPPASQALIDLGYKETDDPIESKPPQMTHKVEAQIQLLTSKGKVPIRATPHSVGYDTYSPASHTLQPQMITKVPLDIVINPPSGSYVQLMSRSGLTLKGVTVHAGVIDPDCRGNITVLLHNSTDKPIQIKAGERVAQILFKQVSLPNLVTTKALSVTERNDHGFGSTDPVPNEPHTIPTPVVPSQPNIVARSCLAGTGSNDESSDTSATTAVADLPPMPYNIYLSTDPFDDVIPIAIDDFGSHATMGMVLQQCPVRNRPQLVNILPSNPASRIKRWRSTLRNAYITQIDEHSIETIDDVIQAIQQCRTNHLTTITIEFAVDIKPSGIHPTEGIPIIFSDQLNVIAKYVQEIHDEAAKVSTEETPLPNSPQDPQPEAEPDAMNAVTDTSSVLPEATPPMDNATVLAFLDKMFEHVPPIIRHLFDINYDDPVALNSADSEADISIPVPQAQTSGQKFTPKQIRESPDYHLWRQSQFQQLDMYDDQGMFGLPERRQRHMNVWKLLWTYLQKPPPDNRLKARCVVNGSKHARKAAQVGHTFANSLGQDSERLFWALAAKLCMLVIGADVSNAFAEAPTADEHLYIQPDDNFRDWWENHKKRPPVPPGWVLRIKYAFQGHPEAPFSKPR